jgi:hypothetical protein
MRSGQAVVVALVLLMMAGCLKKSVSPRPLALEWHLAEFDEMDSSFS